MKKRQRTAATPKLRGAVPMRGELELLRVLWASGPISLAEVHDRLGADVAYTTVQTRLNRLVTKGWVQRDKQGRQPFQYSAKLVEQEVRKSLMDRAVEGNSASSIVPLVVNLVESTKLTPAELSTLKQMLKKVEKSMRDLPQE